MQAVELPEVHSHAPAVAPVRRRVLRGVVALLAFLVAVSVGLQGPAAEAATITPSPVTIGETVATAGSEFAVREEGVAAGCAATGPAAVACLGISTAVSAGILAYSTKDIWLPWVQNLWSAGVSTPDASAHLPDTSGHDCVTLDAATLSNGNTELDLTGLFTQWCYSASFTAYLDHIVCTDGTNVGNAQDTNAQFTWTTGGAHTTSNGYSNVPVPNVCPAGQTIVSLDVQEAAFNTQNWTQKIHVGAPWPAAKNTQTTSVDCQHMDGSNTVTTITNSEVGNVGRLTVPSCSTLGSDWFPKQITVGVGPAGGRQTNIATITPKSGFFTDFADCFDHGVMTCVVRVWIGTTPCTVGAAGCVTWQSNSSAQCKWGAHIVPVADCQALAHAYDPATGTRTVTGTNTDGSVDTSTPTSTAPGTGTSPGSGTSTFPGSGANPSAPGTVPGTGSNPDSSNCYGDAWSWNPVDWIYVPVKCAMMWAFVPKTPFSARITDITGRISGRAPFSWVAGLGGIAAVIPAGDCPNWTIKVGTMTKNVVCDSTFTGAIRTARPVFLGMMVTLALWPMIRSLAYASIPILSAKAGER